MPTLTQTTFGGIEPDMFLGKLNDGTNLLAEGPPPRGAGKTSGRTP